MTDAPPGASPHCTATGISLRLKGKAGRPPEAVCARDAKVKVTVAVEIAPPAIESGKVARVKIAVSGGTKEGTYPVHGNKLIVRETFADANLDGIPAIIKLTDSELVRKGRFGTEEYLRLEEK